jgi:hypothetical protein
MREYRWLVAVLLSAMSLTAAAATMTVAWNSPVFNPAAVNVGVVTFPGGSSNTDAGRFEGRVTAWTDIDPATFYANKDHLFAYCFDLAQTLQSGAAYTVSPGAPASVLDWLGAVNAHFGGDAYRWLNPANGTEAAAIQLGIWEALFNDDFALATGLVKFGSVNASVTNLFNDIADERGISADLQAQYVMVLTSRDRQDVITARLPEPASVLLVGVAALAAGLARRRR